MKTPSDRPFVLFLALVGVLFAFVVKNEITELGERDRLDRDRTRSVARDAGRGTPPDGFQGQTASMDPAAWKLHAQEQTASGQGYDGTITVGSPAQQLANPQVDLLEANGLAQDADAFRTQQQGTTRFDRQSGAQTAQPPTQGPVQQKLDPASPEGGVQTVEHSLGQAQQPTGPAAPGQAVAHDDATPPGASTQAPVTVVGNSVTGAPAGQGGAGSTGMTAQTSSRNDALPWGGAARNTAGANVVAAVGRHEDLHLFNRGYTKMLQGAYADAVNDFERLLTDFRESRYCDEALYYKALSLSEAGEPDRAVSVLRGLAVERSSSAYGAEAVLKLGELYERIGRFDDAIQVYAGLEHSNPNAPQNVACQQRIAGINERQGRYGEALDNWSNSQAWNGRVFPQDANGNWYYQNAQNRIAFLKANRDNADQPLRLYENGLVQLKAKRYPEARACFQDLLTKFPTANLADLSRLQLATCRKAEGQLEEATRLIEELCKTAKDGEALRQARAELAELESAATMQREQRAPNVERQQAK